MLDRMRIPQPPPPSWTRLCDLCGSKCVNFAWKRVSDGKIVCGRHVMGVNHRLRRFLKVKLGPNESFEVIGSKLPISETVMSVKYPQEVLA